MIIISESKKRKSSKIKITMDLHSALKELSEGKFPKYDRTETLRDFSRCKSFEEGARSVIMTMLRLKGAPIDDIDLIKKYEMSILSAILKG
ncbi:hypothetical protein LIS04_50 [Listeria phage LIS04]|nr:hypothetical protein LIS04_50 [Listeria phage LIS04]